MKKLLKHIPIKGEFAKNALTLTIGTGIAQLFPMLFYPILGRIFTPAEFGLLATLTSITSILTVIASGKYESSILITKTKEDAANVIGLVLLLSFFVLLFAFITLQLFSSQIAELFHEPNIKHWLLICPLSAFSIIIFKTYNEWCVRNKYFISLSWNKIINAGATTFGKLLLGILRMTGNGLVFGDLIGRIISASGCVYKAIKKDKNVFLQISLKKIRISALQFKDFPKFFLPGSLIDVINSQLPTLVIASIFLSTDVGYYGMAGSLLSVPASVLSIAIMDVFRQRANEEWIKNGNCKTIYNKTVRLMFFMIIPISILLFIILPDLFSFLLGNNWRIAGIYARILMPNIVILFMYQVVSAVFIIANKMKSSFIWQFFSISLTIVSLYIGAFMFKDIQITLISYVIARSIANLTRFYLTYKYSHGIRT